MLVGQRCPEPLISTHPDHPAKWGHWMTSELSQQDQNPHLTQGGQGGLLSQGRAQLRGVQAPLPLHPPEALSPWPGSPLGGTPVGPSHSSATPRPLPVASQLTSSWYTISGGLSRGAVYPWHLCMW